MGELIDVVNFLEIQNSKTANSNQERLQDLIGQANFIAASSGRSPMSWYEFKQQAPEPEFNRVGNAVIGAGAGAALMAGLAVVFPPLATIGLAGSALTGAVLGGLVGGYTQTHNTGRSKQIDAYENYLNSLESQRAQTLSVPQPEQALPVGSVNGQSFADKYVESKDCGCSKSR